MERLRQLTFQDRARAHREIGELSRALPATTVARFDLLLSAAPAPETALHSFLRLLEQNPAAFRRVLRSVRGLRYLIAIFSHSHFLSEEILRHPEWIEYLLESGTVQKQFSPEQMKEQLADALPPGPPAPVDLALFRRKHLVRILIRDVLGLGSLPEITSELTALADAIVETACERIREELIAEYGTPRGPSGKESRFAVIALGKMGGEELNYSSDIDLMFLYSANGETDGPQQITNKEFFKHAANRLTSLLSTYTPAGMCYRVDLRLRPDGSLGEICLSLEGAFKYYADRARDWELQMMIKSRVAAGDRATGRALLEFVEPRTYATTLDFSAVEALSVTRERLNEKLAARQRAKKKVPEQRPFDVKLDRGGIRDVEFLVQCLQRLHGGTDPWVRHGGTMLALARLHDKGFLSEAEYGRLVAAYQFLRHVEHRLQIDDDRQTHALPVDRKEVALLANRMPDGGGSADWLLAQIQVHFEHVREIYDRVVHTRTPSPAKIPVEASVTHGAQPSNIVRALEQRAPNLAQALHTAVERATLKRGYRAFEHFLERVSSDPVRMDRLDSDPALSARVIDLFEHSPYFGEMLIRTPELLDEVAQASLTQDALIAPNSIVNLRKWYRREMVRIQAASLGLAQPIFDTLARTSDLADAVIARAYEIAIAEIRQSHPPADASYEPSDQLWVVALGRLGMGEFDLASDADLVFVLADSEAAELQFWTRVAERLVDLITAYTGEGVLFAVDTRLRPNGNDGPLVQTESAFKDYFDRAAEAWEGITYMKSRAIAGDPARAEFFLHELQDVDWRRYGQGGRSRHDLKQMRIRIEKEQGIAHPFKSGRGGYYDIDFILMYLRLKSAGIFFKVLNTPARIEVLENMGHLDRTDAEFLDEAATFYRALDHGIRLITGHAQDKLPSSEAQVETLVSILQRWTPIPLGAVDEIRSRTRSVFERIFG
jgi:glutamate-ammonia-ligase adenylyltransferase